MLGYYLTDKGSEYKDRLTEGIMSDDPDSQAMDIKRMRQYWILDQYDKGKQEAISSPILYPVFKDMVDKGYLAEYDTEVASRRLSGFSG